MKNAILVITVLLVTVLTVSASTPNWKVPKYSITAREMDVRQALDSFGIAQGIPVVFSEGVPVTPFSGVFQDMPADDFLNQVATICNLTWYYDGTALYIYGAGEILSTLQELRYMKAEEVCSMLKELGIEDERFPIKATSNGELLLVSGPPRYVSLVTDTIAKADILREQRTFNEVEMRLFPLKHTWADDVNFSVNGAEGNVKIKGIATLLDDMMSRQAEGNSKDKATGADGDATTSELKLDSGDERLAMGAANRFQPIIKPDNRLNAVLIRDAAIRMPIYEKIISELDQPQKVIEITVTMLEFNRDDALDWQLSIKALSEGKNVSGGVGQVAGALFDAAGIGGSGLAGALSYIKGDLRLDASLTALDTKKRARSISRTMLLTMNNMAAELSDMKSFHAKVTGKEAVSFEEVTAGTMLQIQPRVVNSLSSKGTPMIWMTLTLQDGGFESVTVDEMPLSSRSELTTQAAVFCGDSLMLAGYMRDIDEKVAWGIPFLRDIPFIGWIFGGLSDHKETVQRIFILTPHILDLDAESLAREQALRQRDITLPESIQRSLEDSDAERKIREVKLDAEERHVKEDAEQKMKRVKFEIKKEDDTRRIQFEQEDKQLEKNKEEWNKALDESKKEFN